MSLEHRFPAGRWIVVALMGSILGFDGRAAEIHVRPNGDDQAAGAEERPLRTVQAAAERAMPGDTVTVHAGVYREWVRPPRGGESEPAGASCYRAAKGERVEIEGSEEVKGWVKVGQDIWKTSVPNERFGGFNPYREVIHGDSFDPRGRKHHVGAIYLDGEWLTEAAALEDVLKQKEGAPLWFGEVDAATTTLWARFPGSEPERARGRDERPACRVLSRTTRAQLHHRAGIHCARCRDAVAGAADRRAGRLDRHALEQGLGHRGQRGQSLGVFGHRAGETRRRMGQHVGGHRRGVREDHRTGVSAGMDAGEHRASRGAEQPRVALRTSRHGGSLGAAFSTR